MTTRDIPGADGYVEAECRAAEAHGTFAVPRFAPAAEQPQGRVRRIGLVRGEDGWRFDVETLEELGMVLGKRQSDIEEGA